MPLYRSRHDRIFGGVCGGMATSLGWSGFRVRVLYVLVSILSAAFPGILVYLILWIAVPQEP
jgi:phage shock protein PspC (stress-responsive transcriptional regulator)